MKINHEETKKTKKEQKNNLRALRFFVVDFLQEMMKRMTWPILLIVFLALSVVAQTWMDSQRRTAMTVEETLYISSGEAIKSASLGFDGLMADIYWIRTLLYFGEEFERQRGANQYFDVSRLKLLQPLLDITVELDPKHIAAYRFGAVFLPDIDADAAIRFVQRGIRNNPDEWQLYQDLGFVQWRRNRFREAAEAYARGSGLPGAPAWMQTMPALMLAKGGERETARAMFLRLYEQSDDPFVKQVCKEQVASLDNKFSTETPQTQGKGKRDH